MKYNFTVRDILKFRNIAALSFVFLVYFGLRLVNLTEIPVFADEAIYIRWAQIMKSEPTLRFLPLSDGKQPLFMWSVIPFLKIFSDPLVAGRFVSVITGFGTLLAVVVISFYLFKSARVAFVAGLVYSLSPFSLFFDRMALVDSMLSMFGVWAILLSIVVAKTFRLDMAMILGFILGGALLTKSPAVFLFLTAPIAAVYIIFGRATKNKRLEVLKFIFLLGVAYLIGYGMYNILRLGPNFHLIALRNQDYVFPINHLWTNPKDPFMFHVIEIGQWYWMLAPSVFVLLLILAVIFNLKRHWKAIIFLLFWVGIPLFAQAMYAKVFTVRYILPSFAPLAVLAASALVKRNKVTIIFFFLFIAHALFIDYKLLTKPAEAPLPRSERSGYLEEWTAGYGIKEVAVYLRNKKLNNPNKNIVVGTEGFFGTLPNGLEMYLEGVPGITILGVGVVVPDVHPSLLDAKASGNLTYFVINSTRFVGDADKLGLDLISSYPKAERPKTAKNYVSHGPREELYLFEVTDKALKVVGR